MLKELLQRGFSKPRKGGSPMSASTPPADMAMLAPRAKPATVVSILKEAKAGNLARYFELYNEMQETDLHLRSVSSKRKGMSANLEPKIVLPGNKRHHKKQEALLKEFLSTGVVQEAADHMNTGIDLGISVSQVVWDTSDGWIPEVLVPVDLNVLTRDKDEHRLLAYKPERTGDNPIPLDLGNHIIHVPQLKAGLPIRGGLIYAQALTWVYKMLIYSDWASRAEIDGRPVRVGRYDDRMKSDKKAMSVLRRALDTVGRDARIMIPKGMEIEFVNAIGKGAQGMHENFVRFCDEQTSKLWLGETLSTDAGKVGSYAQAKVQATSGSRLPISDARQLTATLSAQLAKPIILNNLGESPDGLYCQIGFVFEEPEDRKEVLDVASKVHALGGSLVTDEIYRKAGLTRPEGLPDVLEPPSPAGSAMGAAYKATSAKDNKDEIDSVVERLVKKYGKKAAGTPEKTMAKVFDDDGLADDLADERAAHRLDGMTDGSA